MNVAGPMVFFLGGVLLTMLIIGMLWLIIRRRAGLTSAMDGQTVESVQLAQIIRLTSQAAIVMDPQGKITWVNEAFERLYGYSLDEARGQTMGELVGTQRTTQTSLDILEEAAKASVSCRVSVINRSKDGREVWIDTEVQPTFGKGGELLGFIELSQDVTSFNEALIQLETKTRETDALLRTINLHAIVSVTDEKGRITDVNDAFCRISGFSRAELLGQDHRVVSSGTHSALFWQAIWSQLESGEPWRGEICNRTKQGDLYWVDSIIAPITGANGAIERYIFIRTDITPLKLVEHQLRANQSLLQRAGRIAGVGGWQFENKPRKLTWTDQNCLIFDREPGFAPDVDNPLVHFDAATQELINDAARQAIHFKKPWDLEVPATTATGRRIWVRSVGEAEFEGDALVRLVGATQDVTERRIAQAKLSDATALLRNVLDAASEVSIIATDPDLLITVFNNGAERLLGYAASEMIGKQTPALFHDAMEVKLRGLALSDRLGRTVSGAEVFKEPSTFGLANDWTYIRKDGSRVKVSLVVTAQYGNNGDVVGYLGIAHDITMRQRYEASLRQAMRQAEQASVAKSQFLANVSHEIRTPMNAILGMLRLLKRTGLNERQLEYTNKTEGAARSLLALLNDVLDFSKVEAGKLTLDVRPFQVERWLRDVGVILSSNLGSKPVELLFDIDPNMPATVIGDDLRLQQVMINLAGNAIKFTSHGEVVLGLHVLDLQSQQVHFQVTVRDTGIGIAPQALDLIFEGFSQAEASTTRRFGGTGLGLAISKRLVELMGGKLTANSTLGKGSTFSFDLTLAIETKAESAEDISNQAEPALQGLHVLVVDDNPTARQVLASQVVTNGWSCDLAHDGEHALSMVIAAANTSKPYQAVFIDWRMPGLDGWETSSRIRQWAPKGRSPIIVMVTVHDREDLAQKPDHQQRLLDAYLVKPVTASMLREAVLGVATADPAPIGQSNHSSPGTPKRLDGMSILLVEDNPNNQQVAIELLKDEGANVDLAANGLEAVQCMLKADGAYDVVLMDIQMPVMDGLTAAIRMRELLDARTPPIVAMTANAQEGDREASLAAGMVDHVAKPFDLDKLVSTLQKHTNRLNDSRRREVTVALLPEVETLAKELGIDMKAAVARLGGRQDVYRRLLVSFSKDLADAGKQIEEWWQKGSVADIKYWLHTIKGLAATLGYQTLADVLIKAERRLASEPVTIDGQGWLDDVKYAVGAAPEKLAKLIEAMSSVSAQDARLTSLPPVSVSDLIDQLKALLELLGRSDMRASDLFDDLKSRFQSINGFDWAPINEAMLQLDFEQAATRCRQVVTQLTKD